MCRKRCNSLLSGDRRAEISRLTKERLDVENLKHKTYQPHGGFSPYDAAGASALGGLPHLLEDQPAKGLGKRANARAKKDAAAG